MTTTLRLRSLEDLVPVLPRFLGFEPARSLLVVGFDGRRVAWVQRTDLVVPPAAQAEALAQVVRVIDRERPGSLLVLAYEEEAGEGLPLLGALAGAAPDWWEVAEVACVRAGRLFRLREGRRWEADGATLDAPGPQACALLQDPAPSRADRVARLACRRPLVARAVCAEVERRLRGPEPLLAEVLAAWAALLGPALPAPGQSRVAALALVLLSCEDVMLRDAVIWAAVPSMPLPPQLDHGLVADVRTALGPVLEQHGDPAAALCDACAELDGPPAAAFLATTAMVAWGSGDSVLAGAAASRALLLDPGQSLAQLVAQCVTAALPPLRDLV